jgi:hypothetical protein
MTLDEAEIDLSSCFVPGQGYVALSRVRSLEGLYLQGFNAMALTIDERTAVADVGFRKRSALAQNRLAQLSPNDLRQRHEKFIMASGGCIEKKQKTQKTSTIKKDTITQTKELLERNMPIQQVAITRGLALSTIIRHAEQLLEQGTPLRFAYLLPSKKLLPVFHEAIQKYGFAKLTPIQQFLSRRGHTVSYDELRLIRLAFWPQKK